MRGGLSHRRALQGVALRGALIVGVGRPGADETPPGAQRGLGTNQGLGGDVEHEQQALDDLEVPEIMI